MDIQRYLLIGAAAALAVMLLGEWTAFKAERAEPMARERLMEQTATPTNGSNDLPKGQVEQAVAVEEDVPVVTLAGDEQASELTPAPASLVTVTTNTLEVVIDLVGGDIIEAALPQFPEAIDQPDEPFVLLEQNTTRTYVAQSGLVGTNGIDSPDRAVYTSDKTAYQSSGTDPLTVSLFTESKDGRVTVEKRFTFTPGSYAVDVAFVVTNQSAERWTAVPFAQLKRDDTLPPSADSSGFGMQPFLGAATTTQDDRFRKFSFDDIEDDPWKGSLQGGWIALLQHYFVTAWVPNPEQTHNYSTRKTGSGFNIAGLTSAPLTVAPGSTNQWTATLYVGPKDQYVLENLSPYLDLTVDYGWLWWIAKPLFWLLTLIQGVVINWGLAIILLTILVKAAFFQLSATSYKSMAKMRKIQPKVQALREQYPDDKQKQSQAMMDLYRKEKINPMGGCLPILIQMPVFIALYWVLMESVELRQAPFALWIKDLSAADPYFVLPLMMGASMFFMQKLNPPPPDPMQAKIMQWLPIVFTFFFLWFPAGLVLYWVVNNLLSMAQQWVITRSIERQA